VLSGNFALVSSWTSYLYVYDVTVPSAPVVKAPVAVPAAAFNLALAGSRLAVTAALSTGQDGLLLYDISSPTSPVLLATVPLTTNSNADTARMALTLVSTTLTAYVADDAAGLRVIDLSVPTNPVVRGVATDTFSATRIATATNPTVGSLTIAAGSDSGSAVLKIINTATPAKPVVLSTVSTTTEAGFGDVAINSTGTLAVVTLGTGGVWTIDLSVPTSPVHIGSITTGGSALSVKLNGTRAYVVNSGSGSAGAGLVILDLTNPRVPTVLGRSGLSGAYDVALSGNYAFVSSWTSYLYVYDVTVPSAPLVKTAMALPGAAFNLALAGSRLAVTASLSTGQDGLLLLNIATPTAPSLLATVTLPTTSHADTVGVALTSAHAYLGDDASGLLIYDLSNPAAPRMVASGLTVGNARGLALGGSRAYVADFPATASIIDVGPTP